MVKVGGRTQEHLGRLRAQTAAPPTVIISHLPHLPPSLPAVMSRYSDAIKILGPKVHETIRTTPVLVVGAGGIGSELRASPAPRRVVDRSFAAGGLI